MTTQTVTAQELMAERPEIVESIIDLILADTITYLVDDDETYSHLRPLFIQPQQDIVQLYKQIMEPVDYLFFVVDLMPLVRQVIASIGIDLFTDMLDTDEESTHSEVLRCFGHGVSFWDNHNYRDFGFSEVPRLKTTLEQPWDIATQILDKIAEAHPEYLSSEDDKETENSDFDIWLASNYTPAGEDESTGELWYLSKSLNEYMPHSFSDIKKQWEKEYYIQELPDENDYQESEGEEEIETKTFVIPTYLLSYFLNGEFAGLDKREFELIDSFLFVNQIDSTKGHWSYDNSEPYTTWTNDVTNVGGTVVDLQWVDTSSTLTN